jgi:membrane-associated phospholipid phosphatase
MLDQSIAEFANRIAQHQPARLLAVAAASWLLAVPVLALLWLTAGATRRRQAQTLTVLVLAVVGALAALGLHQLVDHLYFRPRPYWALPAVHAIGARRGDSSFFSLEAAIAAALAAGLLPAARRWGLVALGAALLIGLGQIASGANYPLDVLVGLAVGAACTTALLPLRHRLQAPVGRLLRTSVAAAAPRRRELRVGVIALILLVGLSGWLVARVQDHGLRIALNRADGRLAHRLPTDARLYRPTTIDTLATGHWRPTRARVYGQVTYVNRELDGDVHVVLKAPDGAFVVLEIIPELPIPAPHDDDRITAWGVVRHDGLHNWWELHPLIGWANGHLTAPAAGGLDD